MFRSVLLTALLLTGRTLFAITMPTVPVGDIGNPNDPATGNLYGGVAYAYNIGKYEVTVGQYTAFLNAVAATDTNSLYNFGMATDPYVAGIARSGSSGSYTYSVIGSADRPTAYIGWGDAARFANWLHNGQPSGAQDSSTTEDGAYTLLDADYDYRNITRNPTATWFIASESEWYKAAYYQPAAQGGDSDGYWSHPMKTNNLPYSASPSGTTPDNTRVGNFFNDDRVANGYDDGFATTGSTSIDSTHNYLTDVGAYSSSPSFYGTFDQGGNVWEWTEAVMMTYFRALRGGSWGYDSLYSSATARRNGVPYEDAFGFRVASLSAVPEPNCFVLYAAGALPLILKRRK